ncbi:MAG: phosphomannomutase/phosphoglucomutase [bacterium]|nr:phosphomannomutase/phosphoglucomutase [bacterium]
MNVNSSIFKAYDIRGLCPGDIDAELAYAIGRGVMATVVGKHKNRTVIVGRDARPTSPDIAKELVRGLRDGGADVIDIGMATTPLFYFSVIHVNAVSGVMVTASHNPAQYNGFKIVKEGAVAIGLDSGLGILRDFIQKGEFGVVAAESSLTQKDFSDTYIDRVTNGAKIRKFKIAIDAGNGMAGILLPRALGRLGIEARSLYVEPDGTFPNHEANPLKEETLVDLQKLMKEHPVDFGIAFDGDADRIRFLLADGTPIPGDILLALLAKEYLLKYEGAAVVYAVNCSRIVPEMIKQCGGVPVRWKIGATLAKAKMREENAILGGEISTHYFYREMGTVESTMLTLRRVCEILTQRNMTLAEAIKQFTKYPKTPEINFEIADKDAALKRLGAHFADAKLDTLDGLTIEYPKWWVNIRASNTEPLLRLNLEAETKELLEEKLAEVRRIILE